MLGFSYHDLMARLQYRGPDDAWQRLKEICDWFGAVQEAGGYRKYYAVAGRGTLQGGGTAGGLGLDFEFVESILVPQTLLYGFLGFNPRIDAIELNPRLPTAWPSLTVNGIHWQGHVINVTASSQSLTLDLVASGTGTIRIHPVPGEWAVAGSTEVIGNTGMLWNPADSRQLRLTRARPASAN